MVRPGRGPTADGPSAGTAGRGERIDPLGLTFGGGRSAEVLRRLEYVVSRRLDGVLQGDYRGLVPGHGSELGETRSYQAGDDVRRIDWNVTARTVEPHVRETIADRELESWVLLDQSPSLEFGTADFDKRELALIALAALGFLTARTGNRFGAVFAGRTTLPAVVPAKGGRTHLLGLLHRAMTTPTALAGDPKAGHGPGRTDLAAGIDRLGALHRKRGLAVVISDFLAEDWERSLGRLATRHETLAVEIIDPRELELPAVGVLTLVDPETGRRREVQTSSAKLRSRYAAAAQAQREAIATSIRGTGADHLVLRTDRDWLTDLIRFVVLRRARAARLPRRTS
ncbi:MAG: DUF58 domain-containing protein [Acidimicrobiales bacterium]|nr:DUF58 domain-containing protein [Acidimicrobiales bacterium]